MPRVTGLRRRTARALARALTIGASFALSTPALADGSADDAAQASAGQMPAAQTSTVETLPAQTKSVAAGSAVPDAKSCDTPVARPAIMFNRWQEDWSVLANPCVPKRPFDTFKYMPLFGNPANYVSLGAILRERVEINDASLFGAGSQKDDTYLLQRAEVHADIRFGKTVQIFVQLEDAQPYGKDNVSPVDKNPLDLRQAFIAFTEPLDNGTLKLRFGRQEMAFDLQRFVSVRDGPNVRQAFDAAWADYEIGPWRIIGYATQPVQYRDGETFDDVSNGHQTFSGVRVERHDIGPGDLSAYYSRYNRDNAKFIDAGGNEHRDVFDTRYAGNVNHIDWDIEGMYQSGHVGNDTIGAWAFGTLSGYTLASVPWTPRLGLQVDAASGDTHPGDGRLGTFNPLFPNGYYFALAGYTGYTNVVHVKPSLTVKPSKSLSLMAAVGLQWRQTTGDAVYAQGSQAVPNTAGHGNLWTGFYTQIRADWIVSANVTTAIEAVHFQVGDTLREAGGRNADYVGAEVKFGW